MGRQYTENWTARKSEDFYIVKFLKQDTDRGKLEKMEDERVVFLSAMWHTEEEKTVHLPPLLLLLCNCLAEDKPKKWKFPNSLALYQGSAEHMKKQIIEWIEERSMGSFHHCDFLDDLERKKQKKFAIRSSFHEQYL